MIEIKHRYTKNVLFTCDADNLKDAVIDGVKNGAELCGANLCGAELQGADLNGANLYCATLFCADLRDSDLRESDLRGANLYGANLCDSDLRGANLRGANLYGATLYGANLYGEKLIKTPLFIYNLQYWCVITEKHMKLGCKVYTHEEWTKFTDDEISEMDGKASEFWDVWKEPLLTMCKAHRGEL